MIRILEKIENLSLFLWLLLIPTQLGKHFWPEWSHVMGIRSDYLGPILYLNDLVWGVWIISTIFNFKFSIFKQKRRIFNFETLLIAGFVILNILVAGNRWVAIYRWTRLMQGLISYKVIKFESLKVKGFLIWIIPCWIVMESLLGVSQIVSGGSLQGVWYWLGERRFVFTTIGIAQMSVFGEGLVRAYGTFSHPNSMAGFLLVSLLIYINFQKTNLSPKGTSFGAQFLPQGLPMVANKFQITKNKFQKIFYWVVVWLAVLGIVISGSRTVWGLGIGIVIINLQSANFNLRKKLGFWVIGLGLFLLVLGMVGINYKTNDFVGGWDNDSLNKRISLNSAAVKMWKDNLWLGIGAGNFVVNLPEYQNEAKFYWLQPVHNIFLLMGTELGILGVVLVVKFIIFNPPAGRAGFKFLNNKKNWVIIGVILITGMVDHYWISLPQNWNLMMVVLGVL